ncbi:MULTISPECIES: hypothetical protein [Mesorhizobium]|uniref:hypothetical protein n=1 Tax=Mesorhizobium TaxID=68287 RepID=UPI001140C0B6|nr:MULTISPECIES: hypothetical protein [Mesorhizobium]QIA25558.1 hypothetical protein A9K68_030610 [Mesorhizobium sp. AA22]
MAGLALEAFIDETVRLSGQNGYHPTTFIGMRQRHGTVKAISRLVENGDVQSGFKRLQELGLLDWTIEAAVIKFPAEFSPATRECAEFRLRLAKIYANAHRT